MEWSRSPFRITLGGGGTDLPAFYSVHGGVVTTCAIDKHIYVGAKRNIYEKRVRVQYLDVETVDSVSQLVHSRARVALQHFGIDDQVEVVSVADLAAQTGLGSSGSYLVALINCLSQLCKKPMSKAQIAELACHLEMNVLKEPVGKQDQYIASFGGVEKLVIDRSGAVEVIPVKLPTESYARLANNCRMYFTNVQRSASAVLQDQAKNIKKDDSAMKRILQIGLDSTAAIEQGRLDDFGALMHEHWTEKKKLSAQISIGPVDEIYSYLLERQMILGGKIVGAGGGGFLLLYTPKEHQKLDEYMQSQGYRRLEWSIDFNGVSSASWGNGR